MRLRLILAAALALACATRSRAQSQTEDLARMLRDKQIITASEFDLIVKSGPDGVARLTAILRQKGLLTPAEAASLNAPPAVAPAPTVASTAPRTAPTRTAQAASTPPKAELKIYGTVLFNAFYNDAGVNNIDIPTFATVPAPGPQENFGATARQTRLDVGFSGLTAARAQVSGLVEADFLGGSPSFPNGVNFDIFRLRLAYGRLDWQNFAVEFGQDWNIFAPLNPTSYAAYAIPEFSASGNLWIRTPQIRTEWKHHFGHSRTFLWQMAALDPNIGDDPAAFTAARLPRAGELGRLPAVESRLAFTGKIDDRDATIGVSGHWGRAKNVGVIDGFTLHNTFDSWGAAVDWNLPFTKHLGVSGEAFAGRALGLFSGGVALSLQPLGLPGDRGIGSRGGWMQLQWNIARKWQSNTAYGIDAPEIDQILVGGRRMNQSYMSNVIYHLSPNVAFALEWHRFITSYRNLGVSTADQFNLAAAYTF